jgi:hypothetical protein
MNEPDEVRKWLTLGYETYGPVGARAIARAMGLPLDRQVVTSLSNGAETLATKSRGSRRRDDNVHPSTYSNSSLRKSRTRSPSVLACPRRPPRGSSGWRPYNDSGDPGWFHCGYEGYLEDREPTPEQPVAECFYDERGELVDENHSYSGCRGTPDSYPASDWWNHIFADPGGIWEHGLPAYLESRRHAADEALRRNRELLRKHGYPPYSVGPFRAPLPRLGQTE